MKRRSDEDRLRAAGLTEHDPSLTLRNPERVFRAFLEALKEGDYEAAIEVLIGGLEYVGRTDLSRRYGIPRRTIYNLLGKHSVPSLELVAKICQAINKEASLMKRKRLEEKTSAAVKRSALDELVYKQVKAGHFTEYSSVREAKKHFSKRPLSRD